MSKIGVEAVSVSSSHAFWSAVIGGWMIALVAWLVSGSHSVTGSVMLIWLLAFVVGIGHFAHSIATSGEILAAVLNTRPPTEPTCSGLLSQLPATSVAGCYLSRCSSTDR